MIKGAQLVLKTVHAIEKGNYRSIVQSSDVEIKHAPKIFKETCQINWAQTSEAVRNFVRGLSPYPSAWTILNDKVYKIFKGEVKQSTVDSLSIGQAGQPLAVGELKTDNKTYLYIKTSDGWISIEELQPEGKKKMNIQEFLRGNKI
jgi:methionyl-tRNA formyltransferase